MSLLPLQSLARELNIYADEFRKSRKVKVSSSEMHLCFQWFDDNGKLNRKKIARTEFGRHFVAEFGPAIFLTDGSDDALDELLADAGVETQNLMKARLRLAASSVNAPAGKPGEKPDVQVLQRARPGERPTTDVSILELAGCGDAGVVKLDDGSIMIVDTGRSDDIVLQLKKFLARNYKNAQPQIKLIITHSHLDHMGGLQAILHAGFKIDEIVIGKSIEDDAEGGAVDKLQKRLEAAGYSNRSRGFIGHFVRDGAAPLIDLEKAVERDGVQTVAFYPGSDTSFTLHHVSNSKTPNDAGIVVKIVNKGTSWLLTDDITATTMRALLYALPPGALSAGYLKWPHHLWFPAEHSSARVGLNRFLSTVAPHTYVFSNKGSFAHTDKRYDDIVNFIHSMDSSANTFWTDRWRSNLVFR